MSTFSGTVTGISIARASNGAGNRKVYEVACSFTQTFTSGDVAQLVSVDTAISNDVKNGKTFTVRGFMPCEPGLDASGSAVYAVGTMTNTSGTLTFGLGGTTTNAACTGSVTGVSILVVGDES